MQLVVHSPWGSRINRAWGLALRKRFCVGFNFELQASATDEGINISLGPQHSFPVEEVFKYVKSPNARETLLQAVFQGPLFPIRWRWTASRALVLLRQVGGKRVPTAIQRMRSDDLLAAVFPDAAACQDNMPAGANIVPPDHPLVFEAVRDCLTEALDLAGLEGLLTKIESGEIEVYGKDTVQPSVFAHQILNAMPYAFLDGAPLEERRARAVTLRRALPENARDLGALDPEAIAVEEANAWPPVRDADEMHDALLSLGVLTATDVALRAEDPELWLSWLIQLAADDRVLTVRVDGHELWLAVERASLVRTAYPFAGLPEGDGASLQLEEAVAELLRGRVEASGPFTVAEMADRLALSTSITLQGMLRLETQGIVLRGRFRPDAQEEEFCDRRILARIHRSTIGRLRREIEPVPVASFIRFLLEWQHATPGSRLTGEAGLVEVVEQLQGFEAAAAAWESSVLPSRLTDFHQSTLDTLSFSGELAWGRFARRTSDAMPSAGLSRNGPVSIALREDVPWLLDPPREDLDLSGAPAEVRDYLSDRGASFVPDVVAGTRRLLSEVEDALWVLVAAGLVTADGFGVLRGLISGAAKRVQRASRFARRARVRASSGRARSRWSLLVASAPETEGAFEAKGSADDAFEARAGQLLRRYGVVTRELVAREPMAPPWGQLVRAFRRAEARGEIRGGRFIAGLVGEQFAMPDAVDALRAVNRREATGDIVRVSACDPLNLVGILTPGPRVPAVLGNEVLYRDGVPVMPDAASVAGHEAMAASLGVA